MNKKMRSGIAVLLAGLTMCFASACGNEAAEKENLALQQRLEELLAASSENENTELEKEKLALQQRLEELQQQNSSMLAEKDSLQQQFDELKEQNQAVLDELKGLEDTIYGPPLESGFYKDYEKNAWYENSGEMVALKSDRSRFDIDDVTLDFYFGDDFINPQDVEKYGNRFFDIYFAVEPDSNVKYFAKHVEESYYSKEYEYAVINRIDYGYFYRYEYKFKKCHTLTIPKELFNEGAGRIHVVLCFSNSENECGEAFWALPLYYKIEYGKIAISASPLNVWGNEV